MILRVRRRRPERCSPKERRKRPDDRADDRRDDRGVARAARGAAIRRSVCGDRRRLPLVGVEKELVRAQARVLKRCERELEYEPVGRARAGSLEYSADDRELLQIAGDLSAKISDLLI